LIFPLFGDSEAGWPRGLRIFLYLIGLFWCFAGVAIIADVFMGAIEKITSRKVQRRDPESGKMVTRKVWNDTVANLTLMALGSSAPEIMLSVFEIVNNNFYSGALGPSTIVGSAAFNLLVIVAVCISALPDGDTRLINDLGVYSVTAFGSIFAYVWLLFILEGHTKNRVDLVEGILTFLFFPLLVLAAYLTDTGRIPGCKKDLKGDVVHPDATEEEINKAVSEVKLKYGDNLTDQQVAALIDYELKSGPPHSRAFHRVNATRYLFRGKQVASTFEKKKRLSKAANAGHTLDAFMEAGSYIYLEETECVVLESCGTLTMTIRRAGEDCDHPVTVHYFTTPGTAQDPSDYEKVDNRVTFAAGDKQPKTFDIQIVQSNSHEETEEFYVDIELEGDFGSTSLSKTKRRATIHIVDENHHGKLRFADDPPERHLQRGETDKVLKLKVLRMRGCDGTVSCTVVTEADTAMAGTDFVHLEDTLTFKQGETWADFEVKIKGKKKGEGTEQFRIILKDPTGGVLFDEKTDGGSDSCISTIYLEEQEPHSVYQLMKVNQDQMNIAHAKWKDQIIAAVYVNGGDTDPPPTVGDRIIHVVAFFWKVLFALVPPVEYCGGWLCFFVALGMIAFVTILIGDLASLLGCVMGVSDFATAITLVAIGTSLPDTFASKTAALQDTCADASIGNVTGSNSVNVFLGLGLPWMIASVYWQIKECKPGDEWSTKYPEEAKLWPSGAFIVKSDGLPLSVAVFSVLSIICMGMLALRRKFLGAELGGPKKLAYASSAFFVLLWVVYITTSIASSTTS